MPVCEEVLTVFTMMSRISIFFQGILKEKQSPESLFGNWDFFGTHLSTMTHQCNYQNFVLKRATGIVLASLASSSAVSRPT